MIARLSCALVITLLLSSTGVFGQTEIIVYDGYTGIYNVSIHDDTARIITLLPGSPAEKAGILFRDQILSINDSAISGQGISSRSIQDLLYNKSGEFIDLTIKRKDVDSLLNFSFCREPYLNQIQAHEFEYLVDSLEQWDISQIMSDSLDSLFVNPLMAKSTVYSVEEGSPAAKIGILPGDQIISLMDELDKDAFYHISSSELSTSTNDTSFSILRGDSLIHYEMEPSVGASLKGIESQFAHDFSYPCAWLKIKTLNRISENRNYILNLPEMDGADSANFFYKHHSGAIVEKRAGILIPIEERDFIYKDWHAASLALDKGEEQTFYIRWKAVSSIGAPMMSFIAQETIVKHDRIERMVLFALMGMMTIISFFFIILFFALRDRQYIYFAFYILTFASFLFVGQGYLGEFLWKERVFQSVLIYESETFTLSLVTIFFLLFGISYLELKKGLAGWYWSTVVILGLVGIRVVSMLLASIFNFDIEGLFEGVIVVIWLFSVAVFPLFLLVVPSILRIREGFTTAWYFIFANLVLIPLAIISISQIFYMNSVLIADKSVLLRILQVSGVFVAAILQILIFSMGLARKLRIDEQEKKISQKRIIDQLTENEKLKDKVNRELEQKVQERTREISEQKQEIESQRDEIEAQRDLVFAQKKEITDSIGYAQRIQAAILPHKTYLDKVIPEYFVLYKPRDIVSGDFYWIKEVESSIVVVVADCTGHGVPGAFMSMLGITLLNELFVEGRSNKPGEILEELRTKVKAMLFQEGSIRDQKDGMDMAIAIINNNKKELQFSGAYNPLYLIRDRDELIELKGDKQPIGIHWEETKFKDHIVKLKENDTVYVFSDGFVDQYGGTNRKKFKTHKFKELLLSVQSKSMDEQKQHIEETFELWRGNVEQIDDVCIVGVRI